jgi:hypothetical protein
MSRAVCGGRRDGMLWLCDLGCKVEVGERWVLLMLMEMEMKDGDEDAKSSERHGKYP